MYIINLLILCFINILCCVRMNKGGSKCFLCQISVHRETLLNKKNPHIYQLTHHCQKVTLKYVLVSFCIAVTTMLNKKNLEKGKFIWGMMISEVSIHRWPTPLLWAQYEAKCHGERAQRTNAAQLVEESGIKERRVREKAAGKMLPAMAQSQ